MKTPIKILTLLLTLSAYAQKGGLTDFPKLEFTNIPGVPKLSQPILVTAENGAPLISEGFGLAAPAFYDWDGDGLKDLLIGEFGSGVEHGKNVGNFIRIYKNTGTAEKASFTGQWDYAKPPFELPGNGTPYSVAQYCCMGFTPQFIDLNNDGQLDLITGQYYGEVTWFQGSKLGFSPGELLPQDPYMGGPRNEPNGLQRKAHQFYWIYSSASFGDFTGDGKPDLIIGGRELRISKNIGTLSNPEFAQREPLLDIKGDPLNVRDLTKDELKYYDQLAEYGYKPPASGSIALSPYVVDWDQDGILDLLVTQEYSVEGDIAVLFFKGVWTKEGKPNEQVRFRQGVPLFTAKNNAKALPGYAQRVAVVDWNHDGVNDLLIGTSVLTMRGEFNGELSWNWQYDIGIDKNAPGYLAQAIPESQLLQGYKDNTKLPKDITLEDYKTIWHQGYIYVMLGHKDNQEKNP